MKQFLGGKNFWANGNENIGCGATLLNDIVILQQIGIIKLYLKGLKLQKHMIDISHPPHTGSTFPIGRRQWEIEMPGRLPRACCNSPSLSFNPRMHGLLCCESKTLPSFEDFLYITTRDCQGQKEGR